MGFTREGNIKGTLKIGNRLLNEHGTLMGKLKTLGFFEASIDDLPNYSPSNELLTIPSGITYTHKVVGIYYWIPNAIEDNLLIIFYEDDDGKLDSMYYDRKIMHTGSKLNPMYYWSEIIQTKTSILEFKFSAFKTWITIRKKIEKQKQYPNLKLIL